MRHLNGLRMIALFAVVILFISLPGNALAGNNPVDENWWPSEFGADDQAGAVKYITPQKRIEAARLVKQGKTATLGMPYYNGMPLVPGRTYALSIPGAPTHGPLRWEGQKFQMTFMDELVTAEIGQVGTQWDGLGHPMIRVEGVPGWKDGDYFYNKTRLQDVESPRGLKKMGTEHPAEFGFFTRGILIDVAALKGVPRLAEGLCHHDGGLQGRPATAGDRRRDARGRRALPNRLEWSLEETMSERRSSGRRITRSSARASPASARKSATIWPARRSP